MFTLICPHCNHNNRKDAEDLPWQDDDIRDYQCAKCNNVFYARANVSIEHETAETEDDFD